MSRTVLNVASQGEDDVFEVRTGNSKIRGNARHPLLVRRPSGEDEWVRIGDLKAGDKM